MYTLASPSRVLHLLLFFLVGAHGAFDLTLLITREVRGAAFPVDSANGQCSAADVSSCSCFGGAARRRAYMGPYTSEKRVALDTGSYFSGGGRFYAAYNGSASGDFFADSGYAAYGLTYRDFNAGAGLSALASYLYHIRNSAGAADLVMPPATVTNLNEANLPELNGLVSDYTLVPLGVDGTDHTINHTMAVLSLTDPTHLAATQPVVAAQLLPFSRALAVTVYTLQSLAVVPSVIVVLVTDMPISAAELAAAGSMRAAKTAALADLVRAAIGVDVFILGAFDVEPSYPHLMRNWANEDVLIVPAASAVYGTSFASAAFGTVIQELKVQLSTTGKLVTTAGAYGSSPIELNCSSDEHAATKTTLLSREAGAGAKLNKVVGSLATAADSLFGTSYVAAGDGASTCASGARVVLPPSTAPVCGCRVDACGQGVLVADAYASVASADFALLNAGALKSGASLAKGSVTLGAVTSLLPFTAEVVRLTLPGSVVKLALAHGLSHMNLTDAATSPSGRFLQVSSNLKYEWFFKASAPTLSLVYVQDPSEGGSERWVRLNETNMYTVATNAFVAGGGDGFAMLTGYPMVRLGVSDVEAVVAWLGAKSGASAGGAVVPDSTIRIRQLPNRMVLQVTAMDPPIEPPDGPAPP